MHGAHCPRTAAAELLLTAYTVNKDLYQDSSLPLAHLYKAAPNPTFKAEKATSKAMRSLKFAADLT
jgi:hypothetical protein